MPRPTLPDTKEHHPPPLVRTRRTQVQPYLAVAVHSYFPHAHRSQHNPAEIHAQIILGPPPFVMASTSSKPNHSGTGSRTVTKTKTGTGFISRITFIFNNLQVPISPTGPPCLLPPLFDLLSPPIPRYSQTNFWELTPFLALPVERV